MIYSNQRVGVLVDVQNMYHSAKNLYNSSANFTQILETATSGRQLIRAFAYVIKAESPKEQGFFEALQKAGYEMKMKDIQVFAGGAKKADWDVGIAVDAMKIAQHLDVIVLVTGDGDFRPLVSYLREKEGCRVELISFGRSTSSALSEEVDLFIDMDQDSKKYLTSSPGTNYRKPRTVDDSDEPRNEEKRNDDKRDNQPRTSNGVNSKITTL